MSNAGPDVAALSDRGLGRTVVPRPRRGKVGEAICDRIAQDAQRACHLFHELELALDSRPTVFERVSGSPDRSPIPRISVIEARTEIRGAVVAAARYLPEQLGPELCDDSIENITRLVAKHAQCLANQQGAADAVQRLSYVANSPTFWRLAYTADWLYVGTCPVADAAGPAGVCGTRLYQMVGAAMIQCAACGTEAMIERWQQLFVGTAETWVDAYALAAHLSVRWKRKVEPATIRGWARRSSRTGVTARTYADLSSGTIRVAAAYDDKGRALYDFHAALAYADRIWGR